MKNLYHIIMDYLISLNLIKIVISKYFSWLAPHAEYRNFQSMQSIEALTTNSNLRLVTSNF